MNKWPIFRGDYEFKQDVELPEAPSWRTFRGKIVTERHLPSPTESANQNERGARVTVGEDLKAVVNLALALRRPLLLTGKPGSGKSSLIYAVARELCLGEVLRWPITSRSTLKEGLYEYDAIGRLQQQSFEDGRKDIGSFLKLNALGTALLPTARPRALLIDEIDKSDIDLPNDLLNVFEEGEFQIPELQRLNENVVAIRDAFGREKFPIENGLVQCREFPFVVMTSNGERDFPAPFLRRCISYDVPPHGESTLTQIVANHLGASAASAAASMIKTFAEDSKTRTIATDQLLNAAYLVSFIGLTEKSDKMLFQTVFRDLVSSPAP